MAKGKLHKIHVKTDNAWESMFKKQLQIVKSRNLQSAESLGLRLQDVFTYKMFSKFKMNPSGKRVFNLRSKPGTVHQRSEAGAGSSAQEGPGEAGYDPDEGHSHDEEARSDDVDVDKWDDGDEMHEKFGGDDVVGQGIGDLSLVQPGAWQKPCQQGEIGAHGSEDPSQNQPINLEAEKPRQQEADSTEDQTDIAQRKVEKKATATSKFLKMKNSNCRMRVAIDLSFDKFMAPDEIFKLAYELKLISEANIKAENPLQLYFCGTKGDIFKVLTQVPAYLNMCVYNDGRHFSNVFNKHDIVYLTGDSPNPLFQLSEDKVYIIGGLTDHGRYGRLTHTVAEHFGFQHARFCIKETDLPSDRHPKIMNVDQAFMILLLYSQTQDWVETLTRTVYRPKKSHKGVHRWSMESQLRNAAMALSVAEKVKERKRNKGEEMTEGKRKYNPPMHQACGFPQQSLYINSPHSSQFFNAPPSGNVQVFDHSHVGNVQPQQFAETFDTYGQFQELNVATDNSWFSGGFGGMMQSQPQQFNAHYYMEDSEIVPTQQQQDSYFPEQLSMQVTQYQRGRGNVSQTPLRGRKGQRKAKQNNLSLVAGQGTPGSSFGGDFNSGGSNSAGGIPGRGRGNGLSKRGNGVVGSGPYSDGKKGTKSTPGGSMGLLGPAPFRGGLGLLGPAPFRGGLGLLGSSPIPGNMGLLPPPLFFEKTEYVDQSANNSYVGQTTFLRNASQATHSVVDHVQPVSTRYMGQYSQGDVMPQNSEQYVSPDWNAESYRQFGQVDTNMYLDQKANTPSKKKTIRTMVFTNSERRERNGPPMPLEKRESNMDGFEDGRRKRFREDPRGKRSATSNCTEEREQFPETQRQRIDSCRKETVQRDRFGDSHRERSSLNKKEISRDKYDSHGRGRDNKSDRFCTGKHGTNSRDGSFERRDHQGDEAVRDARSERLQPFSTERRDKFFPDRWSRDHSRDDRWDRLSMDSLSRRKQPSSERRVLQDDPHHFLPERGNSSVYDSSQFERDIASLSQETDMLHPGSSREVDGHHKRGRASPPPLSSHKYRKYN